MTEYARVIPTDDTTELLDGDCGLVLAVVTPCPDEPHHVLQCSCGAEIVLRHPSDEP